MLALSNSGESDELNAVIPVLKRLGVPLLALTGRELDGTRVVSGKAGKAVDA